MNDFLEDYNKNPSPEILDRWWSEAGKRDLHNSAMLFAKASLDLRQKNSSQDSLPESAAVYQQLSISGFYCQNSEDREIGQWAAEQLGLDPNVEEVYRNTARKNQVYYIKLLEELCSITVKKELKYNLPEHWFPMNPSIVNWNDELWLNQRTVNYFLSESGHYSTKNNDNITTKNYLVKLNKQLEIVSSNPIHNPDNWPDPAWPLVIGFEDCRLFVYQDNLYCSATVRERNITGLCEMFLFRINHVNSGMPKFELVNQMQGPNPFNHEKNWMPFTPTEQIKFLYSHDPVLVIGDKQNVLVNTPSSIAVENFRGGGQIIKFDNGYLSIVHESIDMNYNLRHYVHRFVYYNSNMQIEYLSPRFKLNGARIEFAAGIAQMPNSDNIVLSYGINDCNSWLAVVEKQQISKILTKIPKKLRNRSSVNGPVV